MKDKTILITGGTGSFGKACVHRLLKESVKKVIVFSRDELKQCEMAREINDPRIEFIIGDVRDKERLKMAFEDADTIIHAAAMKHITACEDNPIEAIKTNILGAQNIIEAAQEQGIKKVIALSTDKAANPINLYGATKLCLEKLFVHAGFSVVRYGNVMGSRGSVIPLFEEQAKTGRLTVTHKDMTRFWITLEDAIKFVLVCLDIMRGGEIFVPKLDTESIMYLAKKIAPDAEIEFIGIRQGEKLHEVLITSDEARNTYDCNDYYIISNRERAGEKVPDDFQYTSQ